MTEKNKRLSQPQHKQRNYTRRVQLNLSVVLVWIYALCFNRDAVTSTLLVSPEQAEVIDRLLFARLIFNAGGVAALIWVWAYNYDFRRAVGICAVISLSNFWFSFPITFEAGLTAPSFGYLIVLAGRLLPALLLVSLYLDADNIPRNRSLKSLFKVR